MDIIFLISFFFYYINMFSSLIFFSARKFIKIKVFKDGIFADSVHARIGLGFRVW